MEGQVQGGLQRVMEQGHVVPSALPSQTEVVVQGGLPHLVPVSVEKGPLPVATPPQPVSQDAQVVATPPQPLLWMHTSP